MFQNTLKRRFQVPFSQVSGEFGSKRSVMVFAIIRRWHPLALATALSIIQHPIIFLTIAYMSVLLSIISGDIRCPQSLRDRLPHYGCRVLQRHHHENTVRVSVFLDHIYLSRDVQIFHLCCFLCPQRIHQHPNRVHTELSMGLQLQ